MFSLYLFVCLFVYLFVCWQDYTETTEPNFTKYDGKVEDRQQAKQTDRLTNADENITFLAEIIAIEFL